MNIAEKLQTIAENEQSVYDKGYSQAKQAEEDKFWDAFTDSGKRTNYDDAFTSSSTSNQKWKTIFDDRSFIPKYEIAPTTAHRMFKYFGYTTKVEELIDWSDYFLRGDFIFDLSTNLTEGDELFRKSGFSSIYSVKLATLNKTFYQCSGLKTIKYIYSPDGTMTNAATNAFYGCSNLENIDFRCVIDCNGLNFSPCKNLSERSLRNIANQLKDNSSGTAKTITFGSTNLAKFTEEEKAEIQAKGWTLK